MPGIERTLDSLRLHFRNGGRGFLSCQPLIEPQSGSHLQSAALAVFIQQEKEMYGMHQMRTLAKQALPLAYRLADETQFGVFEITKPAMDNPRGTTGDS